jgi:alpha-galactosidase
MRACEGNQCVLRFKGLDPDRMYKCEQDGETYSGAFLMNAGLNLTDKLGGDGESFTLYFK